MRSLLRILLATVLVGGVALLAVWQFGRSRHERMLERIEAINREMAAQLELRERMLDRLARTRRVAHVQVLSQAPTPAGGIASTRLRLVELDDDGAELARQDFEVPGDVVMIDGWTVKFGHEQVADGHPLAGHTLLLLRRVYSDLMPPARGLPIDTPGAVPPAYAVTDAGRFQQRVWSHFWQLATDPETAAEFGVRVAQGEVVYKPMRAGETYELVLDAAGGMSLVPLGPAVATGQ